MHQNSKQWRKTIYHLYWSMQLQHPLVVKKEMIEIHHLHSFIFVMPTFKPHFKIMEITKHKFCINQCPSYPRQYPLPHHYHCPHFPVHHNCPQQLLPQLLVAGQASHRTRKQHRLHSTYQGLSAANTLQPLVEWPTWWQCLHVTGGFTVRTTGSLLALTLRNTSVRLASMLNSLAPFSLNCQLQWIKPKATARCRCKQTIWCNYLWK